VLRGVAVTGFVGLGIGATGGFALGARWPLGPNWVTKSFDYDLDAVSPYVAAYREAYDLSHPLDDAGIVITTYQDERVYHTVDACWYLFPQLHSYEVDGDTARLDSVLATTRYLLDGAETHRLHESVEDAEDGEQPELESLWFPYHFEHAPGDLDNGVPWYSGMAQGMMLSHLVRLHEVTGETEWLETAHLVFNSFRHYRNGRAANESPWFVSYVDDGDRRFTTFEEYPSRDPGQLSHVVNGNLYAAWGVFDYLRTTGDRYARTILDRALASLLESFSDYRAIGSGSMYGLTPWSYLTWGNPGSYHDGVTTQLRRTGTITGDERFGRQADALEADAEAAQARADG
jgi:hypothetical protein